MKILVIGSGGREDAILHKLYLSNIDKKLYCAPGNGGTKRFAKNIDIAADDIDGLLKFAKNENIDMTIVGPEAPLSKGIVDIFEKEGLKIFGPDKRVAQLESSKSFTKDLLLKYNIPTAKAKKYTNSKEAIEGLEEFELPVVIKADGLCAGKGVIICNSKEEAASNIKQILDDNLFGDEGSSILLEEYLSGYEASVFCIASGGKLIPMPSAADYQKIDDGDKGENTGGVGCISPNPFLSHIANNEIYKKIIPAIENMLKEEDLLFTGVLFIGFLMEKEKPYVLEFNTRFGDPETQAVLPRLKSDLINIFNKAIDKNLRESDFEYTDDNVLGVVFSSPGYPDSNYKKNIKLPDLSKAEDVFFYHNGTREENGEFYSAGGRVLTLLARGNTLEKARNTVYREIEKLSFNEFQYRSDIGKL